MATTTKMANGNGASPSLTAQKGLHVDETTTSNRNFGQAVWQLARLHTTESAVFVYPALWGACLSAGSNDAKLNILSFAQILFKNWISMAVLHCTFCTFNDICDRDLDAQVERTRVRPLPSGKISATGAFIVFIAWMVTGVVITYTAFGRAGIMIFIPIWILNTMYPFMKRLIPFPQLFLGPMGGSLVFPGWISVSNGLGNIGEAIPLFLAATTWAIYFDMFYASQDAADDKKVGVKSLVVLLGNNIWIFVSYLGELQVLFFAITAVRANMSAIFWIFGIGLWAVNIPRHVLALDLTDRKSGGRIAKANIVMGLHLTIVCMIELYVTRVIGWGNEDYLQVLRSLPLAIGIGK